MKYQPTEQRIAMARKRIEQLEAKRQDVMYRFGQPMSEEETERWRKVDHSCYVSIRRWRRIIEGKEA